MPESMTIEEARAWRAAALQDGWEEEPTYSHEAVERAARMRRDGFAAQVLARPARKEGDPEFWNRRDVASVHVWGPDQLAVEVGSVYSFKKIVAGTRTCQNCGATDVETHRVAFANRCCGPCLPEARKKLEPPGWCD